MSQSTIPGQVALDNLRALGQVVSAREAGDVREKGYYVYLVYNGPSVLQLGKGKSKRMNKCMRGGLAGKHNKAFICAIGEIALGQPNEYAYVRMQSKEAAEEKEAWLHNALGVKTNQEGATLIVGIQCQSIPDIHKSLWERAKTTGRYRALDPVEQQMAEELFELVTYATTKIKRPNKIVSSFQGDNLEGNILMKIGKCYLSNVFEKLTDGYLRYGKHLMTSFGFEDSKRSYSYSPRGGNFFVDG
jgi:hypothetical protein